MRNPTSLDEEGRVTIRAAFREHLEGRLVQILTPRGVLLRPVTGELEGEELPSALVASGEDAALESAG